MLKKMRILVLCLLMVAVAFVAIPFHVSANGVPLPPEEIEATVTIKPESLNLTSRGVFTAFITLPEGYDVSDINVGTLVCEGAPVVRGKVAGGKLIAKFDRQDLGDDVLIGEAVLFTVTGELTDGTPFEGSDTIRVMKKGGK